jgi:nitroreductase
MKCAMELFEALATTRAIRRFRPEPIPDDDLSTILFAATRAPSGSNRQTFRFLVLRAQDAETLAARQLLGGACRAQWAAKRDADGYNADRRPSPGAVRLAAAIDHFVTHFEKIPVVVLACLDRYRAPSPLEGASVYPAVQNLLLAARALGYGGVITQWHSAVEPELRTLLHIPDSVAIHAMVPLGRPMGQHGPVRRRPLTDFVSDGHWGSAAPWLHEPEGVRHTTPGLPRPVDGPE